MKRITITNLSLALMGLLLAAFAIFFIDQGSKYAWPSITSNRPSGYMAFAELLRRDGYEVVLERSVSPRLQPGDLAICPQIVQALSEWEKILAEEDGDAPKDLDTPKMDDDPIKAALVKHVRSGGSLVYFPVPRFFDDQSKVVEKDMDVLRGEGKGKASVAFGDITRSAQERPYWSQADRETPVWTTPNRVPLISIGSYGDARIGIVADGIMATNRFLDEGDNARVLLDLIRETAKPGSRVVFVESVFGNSEGSGLFAAIGPWAGAARWQALLLLFVIIFTLSRRFGLPEVEHPIERGTRDMLVALSTTMRSSRRGQMALEAIASDAIERARRILRLPPSTSAKDILDRLPPGLATSIRNVGLRDMTSKPPAAVVHAQEILRELRAFEQDSRQRGSRP